MMISAVLSAALQGLFDGLQGESMRSQEVVTRFAIFRVQPGTMLNVIVWPVRDLLAMDPNAPAAITATDLECRAFGNVTDHHLGPFVNLGAISYEKLFLLARTH
jgi:hypothetical protein